MTTRTHSRRRSASSVMAALLLVALAACSAAPPGSAPAPPANPGSGPEGTVRSGAPNTENLNPETTPVDGGSLVFAVTGETDGWNPHRDKWAQWSSFVGSSFLEPLAMIDENADAQPWLATGWTSNATYDEWTVTIRGGVSFSNGEPLDAEAVKLNIDDTTKAPLMGLVLGPLVKEVQVLGPLTVKVIVNGSWAAFPTSFLGSQAAIMMAPAMLRSADAGSAHPIGTGPFVFQEWTRDASLKTTKNPRYWRPGEPHLANLEFRVITDPTSLQHALEARDVDVVFTPSADNYAALRATHQVVKNWTSEPMMVVTNTLEKVEDAVNPLHDRHARRALALATDRATIAATIGDGVLPASSIFSPEGPWGQPDDQNGYPAFDLDAAKAEVEAYKQASGASSLSISLLATADSLTSRVAQLLQAQWLAAGIELRLESLEITVFLTRIVSGDYQTAILPLFNAPEPDLNYPFLSSSTAKGPGSISINMSQFSTPGTDAALATGRSNPDRAARKAAYTDLVRELNESTVFIWLYWTPYSIIAGPQVQGLQAAARVPFAHTHPKHWFGELWVRT